MEEGTEGTKGKILGTFCKSAEGNGGEKSNEEALWLRQERLIYRYF